MKWSVRLVRRRMTRVVSFSLALSLATTTLAPPSYISSA